MTSIEEKSMLNRDSKNGIPYGGNEQLKNTKKLNIIEGKITDIKSKL